MWNRLYLLGCIQGWDFFSSLFSFSRLPVMCISFWFNKYSLIKVFSFSSMFVERISGLGDFAFNFIYSTICKLLTYTGMLFQSAEGN